jgi:hypothetical protein
MKAITFYEPPSTADLVSLKKRLHLTGTGMAALAGLGGDNQWRKYTGGTQPRQLSLQFAFFLAARLELSEEELERVFARMRDLGCAIELEESVSETVAG